VAAAELIVRRVVLLTRGRTAHPMEVAWLLHPILYALHSHLQQIPIFFGQIRYWGTAAAAASEA